MSKRINIAHICDKFGVGGSSIHGVSRLFTWWWPEFDRDRFNVSLVGLRPADASAQEIADHGIKAIHLSKSKFDPTTFGALKNYIKQHDIDILHVHGYGACNFGRLLRKPANVKVLQHEHVVDPNMPEYQKWVDRLLRNQFDIGIAVSRDVKDFMAGPRHMIADRIRVIYNGAPLSKFVRADDATTQQLRQQLKINDDTKIICSVSRLDEQKGIPYLIDAFAGVIANQTNKVHLIVVGDGPSMEALKQQTKDLNISESVTFLGHSKQIRELLSLADVFAIPSLWEGTPLTLFEAMAIGTTIVSTNVNGLGEVLEHNETALLAPPADAKRFQSLLQQVLQSDDLRKRLADNAHKQSGEFDNKRTVERIEGIYSELST